MAAAAVIIPHPPPSLSLGLLNHGALITRSFAALWHTYSVMYMRNWYMVCRKTRGSLNPVPTFPRRKIRANFRIKSFFVYFFGEKIPNLHYRLYLRDFWSLKVSKLLTLPARKLQYSPWFYYARFLQTHYVNIVATLIARTVAISSYGGRGMASFDAVNVPHCTRDVLRSMDIKGERERGHRPGFANITRRSARISR